MINKVIKYRYDVLEKVGEGTFYTVYKARDKVLNKVVALKVLHQHLAANKDLLDRFQAETRRAAGLNHPNIARIIEFDEEEGMYYTVVEYVRGTDLKERIRRTAPMAIPAAVDIMIAACEALDHAHKSGVVHGDIRPQNILVSPEGETKVADFGIIRCVAAVPSLQTEAFLKSVYYVAPEIAEGKNAQAASDLYSAGVVMYEMLTGVLPFQGDTAIAIALKHIQDPPSTPRLINPAVPKSVEGIVLKALTKKIEQRYISAIQMIADLKVVRDAMRFGKSLNWSPLEDARPEPEPQEEEEEIAYAAPRFSISRFLMWAAAFIGVVACVSLFIYFTIGANPQEVVVPDVTGKPLAQAQALLAEKDLKAKLVEEYDSKVPAGQIISAAPAPGRTIKAGKEVLLFVSKGAQFASVPDVIGQSESDAREQIQRSGLVPGNVRREYSDTVAQGDVVSQDPKAAVQIAPMQKVNMIVSRGPKPLPAPPIDINPPEVSNNTPSVGDTGVENVPANEPTDADADQTGAGKLRRRNFQVGVAVPKDGEPHRVEIVISDSRNERTVYDREHGSGDSFSSPNLEGYGDEGSIRVYVDGELVKERLFSELDKSGGKPSGGTNR
ncbi:MAG: Stk1 family PASTA domain-containing Ser/Thr kinase [Armatimonadetes bacterium]|nr:Stk1 family PASTA domain-containing Ser/Thr kinase [Armatimonadota bacterium]